MLNFFNELIHNLSSRNEIKNSKFIKELENAVIKEPLFTLDRFEGEYAVLENRANCEMINVSTNSVSKDAKPGCILKFENGVYIVDEIETKKAQEKVKGLVDKLYKKK